VLELTLQVGVNAGSGHGLGESADAALDQPADEDGGTVDVVLLGDSSNGLVLTQVLAVGSAERRVGAWEDVVLLQPCNELGLRALDRKLDLV
jgi:hypothetical protein